MNRVQIKINPYTGLNVISLNGSPLPAYSELNNFMQEPFLIWAPKILETIDRELNDEYELTVVSGTFEATVLETLQREHEECIAFHKESFSLPMNTPERKAVVDDLYRKYLHKGEEKQPDVLIFVEENLHIEGSEEATIENAFVIATNDGEKLSSYISKQNVKFILIQEEEERIQYRNGKCLWYVPEEKMPEILKSIQEYFSTIPALIRSVEDLQKEAASFSKEERQELRLVTEIDPVCIIGEILPIEAGKQISMPYRMFPENAKIPQIRVETDTVQVLECKEFTLKGLEKGKAHVSFYYGEAVIPFQTVEVEVYQKHLAQKLELFVEQTTMESGTVQPVSFRVIPEDAEDISKFQWNVSDSDVAEVDENGLLHAKRKGKCTISLKGEATFAELSIDVLPCVEKIELSAEKIRCYVGEEKTIRARVLPQDCYASNYQWFTTDASVAVVERKSDGTEQIWAKGIGNCQVICRTLDEKVESSCHVVVESTFKKQEQVAPWLRICGILFVAFWILLFLELEFAAFGSLIGVFVTGVLTILAKKEDWLWAFLLMILPILALVL